MFGGSHGRYSCYIRTFAVHVLFVLLVFVSCCLFMFCVLVPQSWGAALLDHLGAAGGLASGEQDSACWNTWGQWAALDTSSAAGKLWGINKSNDPLKGFLEVW